MLGVARDSMEHADMKDGSTVDVDNEGGTLAAEATEAVAVVDVGADALLCAEEVLHCQMPRHVLQRAVLCFVSVQQ